MDPANLAGAPGTLIFFCLLFFHQGKKRRWGIRGKAPLDTRQKEGDMHAKFSDSSHQHEGATVGNHFESRQHEGAPKMSYSGSRRRGGAPIR